jgi:hypothetical protein
VVLILEKFSEDLCAEFLTLFVLLNTILTGVLKEIRETEVATGTSRKRRRVVEGEGGRREGRGKGREGGEKEGRGKIGGMLQEELDEVIRNFGGGMEKDGDFGEGYENFGILEIILEVLDTLFENRKSYLQEV